jgi:peptidoglycan/xylan/chitin deacetylase (PgdA/CDA1 family)
MTSELLDIRAREGLRATFFVLGKHVEQYPDLARRIIADGHAIASHSYTHPDLTTLTGGEIESELRRTRQAVLEATGANVVFARPPYGESNDEVSRQFSTAGLAEVIWTVDTHDWKGASAEEILRAVVMTQPGGVVLMHDTSPHLREALPLIAKHLRDNRICAGKLAPTTERMPVANWYPRAFYVHAERW